MWLLAFKSMLADRGKQLTSLRGMAFVVALVNLRMRRFLGLHQKACLLVDYRQAEFGWATNT
jgi:hypothetical protein